MRWNDFEWFQQCCTCTKHNRRGDVAEITEASGKLQLQSREKKTDQFFSSSNRLPHTHAFVVLTSDKTAATQHLLYSKYYPACLLVNTLLFAYCVLLKLKIQLFIWNHIFSLIQFEWKKTKTIIPSLDVFGGISQTIHCYCSRLKFPLITIAHNSRFI